MSAKSPTIDIIIPVYNSPKVVEQCVRSIYEFLPDKFQCIIIYNDASNADTKNMLNGLDQESVTIIHGDINVGFGQAVNNGVAVSSADYVFVINSDTEFQSDCLSLLLSSIENSKEFVAVNPVMPTNNKFRGNYQTTGGLIETFFLDGYAFLIRREAFDKLGGFHKDFGRGYYEDDDLSRRLIANGWRLGVHPKAILHHQRSASFTTEERIVLLEKNKRIYQAKYPESRRRIVIITKEYKCFDDLPLIIKNKARKVLENGGKVCWFSPGERQKLPCPQVTYYPLRVFTLYNFIRRTVLRSQKCGRNKISELIVLEAERTWHITFVQWICRKHVLKIVFL